MKKGLKILSMALLLILIVSFGSLAHAAPIDTEKPASLTLQYRHNGSFYEGLTIHAYRVAEVSASGVYSLSGDFTAYPVNLNGVTSQSEWKTIASTLSAFAAADGLMPDLTAVTDRSGMVSWQNIQPGIYLTTSVRFESQAEVTTFENFLTVIPYPVQDGSYQYDVIAYPKCSSQPVTPGMTEYRVIKQWRDSGFSQNRPASVKVRILRNGKIQEVQTLSSENNWSYSWTAEEDGSIWQVAEVAIPAGYTVTSGANGNTFLLTNTWQTEDPEDPDDPDDPNDPPRPPFVPDNPGPPKDPDVPDVPDTPDTPDTPGNPDIPDIPDIPDVPDDPDVPKTDRPDITVPPNQPKTGDTTLLWPYAMAMSLSGSLLLLLAIWRIRKEEQS